MIKEIKKIIARYGPKAQKLQAVEEFSELTKVIVKDVNRKEHSKENYLDEITDCYIMIEQLIEIEGFTPSEIQANVRKKLARTLKRMNNDNVKKT